MKKISSILFLLFTICYLLFTHSAHAQTANNAPLPPTQQNYQSPANPYIVPNTTSDVKPSLHTWIPALMDEIMASTVCLLGGIDPITKTVHCLGATGNGKLGYVEKQGGANRWMASTIGTLYQSGFPLSTGSYLAYLKNNFGVARTYAAPPTQTDQSKISGYQGLSPLIPIWTAIRNLAYLLMIIAFIGIGVAIMLRVKIDPRTVMTIENQLPKLIMGLIFVTFSFAISGLMIDGMKVLDGVVFNVYSSIHGLSPVDWNNDIQNAQPWDTVGKLINPPSTTTSVKLGPTNYSVPVSDIVPLSIRNTFLLGGVVDLLTGALGFVGGHIPGLTLGQPTNNGGVANLAGATSLSFGNILEHFFKLDNPQTGASGVGLGDFFDLPGIIASDFRNGSPVGAILDAGSAILGGSLTFSIVKLFSGATIGATGVGNGITFPIGLVLAFPAFPLIFSPIFDTIDILLRNWGLPLIIWLVIYVAIFLAMARLLFSLVFAWAQILFQVVIGPLMIVFGMIPGVKGVGFTEWLKGLAANLMAFPVTIGILLLGSALVQALFNATTFFVPPLIGNGELPVGLLMAISVIFAASNGPQIAKDMFEVKDNKNFGAFGTTSGAALQAVYKAGKATAYGFGKTPTPGSAGGWQAAFGQVA